MTMLTARALGDEWPQPLTPSARDAVRREGTFDGPYARWRSRAVRARVTGVGFPRVLF